MVTWLWATFSQWTGRLRGVGRRSVAARKQAMSWSQRKAAEQQAQYAAVVNAIPVEGVCSKCKDSILRKKASGDYKALRPGTFGKCTGCSQKNVAFAYYTLCTKCARARNACAKCAEASPMKSGSRTVEDDEIRELTKKLEEGGLNERTRRTVLRKIERAKAAKRENAAAAREANAVAAREAAAARKANGGRHQEEEEEDDDDDDIIGSDGR